MMKVAIVPLSEIQRRGTWDAKAYLGFYVCPVCKRDVNESGECRNEKKFRAHLQRHVADAERELHEAVRDGSLERAKAALESKEAAQKRLSEIPA